MQWATMENRNLQSTLAECMQVKLYVGVNIWHDTETEARQRAPEIAVN